MSENYLPKIKITQVAPTDFENIIVNTNKSTNPIKRAPSIIKNLLNEQVYVVKVDNYDRFITFSTIIILIFTIIFFIWGLTIGASEQYASDDGKVNVDNLNTWYFRWKYLKFIINAIAVFCIGVQLYRRGLNPMNHILDKDEFKHLSEQKKEQIRRMTMCPNI